MSFFSLFCFKKSRLETHEFLVLAYLTHKFVGQIQLFSYIPPICVPKLPTMNYKILFQPKYIEVVFTFTIIIPKNIYFSMFSSVFHNLFRF